MNNLKVAYITAYDPDDVHNWSGLGYFIAWALEQQGITLQKIGNLITSPLRRLSGYGKRFVHRMEGRRYLPERAPGLAREYAAQIRRHPGFASADLLFCPSSIPVSFLDCSQPIVFYTDATFAGMVDFYPGYTNLCRVSIRDGNQVEQAALERSRLAIYSTGWAARSAVEHYRVDPGKIKIVPFGANLKSNPAPDDVRAFISARETKVCRLLFVGVDWKRKGGDAAVEVAGELNRRGIPTELSVVGCVPREPLPPFVKLHGFLSKASPRDTQALHRLLAAAHFLILPSRADASPLVINEACAYGLPVLASDVGGIPDLLREGRNGNAFPLDAPARDYADYVTGMWTRPHAYRDLALSTYQEFQDRLNWRSSALAIKALLEETCL
jgi:glycosyltransferase involved in cell wall biosynthesis